MALALHWYSFNNNLHNYVIFLPKPSTWICAFCDNYKVTNKRLLLTKAFFDVKISFDFVKIYAKERKKTVSMIDVSSTNFVLLTSV